jgi:hypothetical protein
VSGKRNALMKGWTSAKDSRSKAKARADIQNGTLRCGRNRVSQWPNFNRL